MTQSMKEYAEKENAKPRYFARDGQVFQRGSTTYNEGKGTCSQGLNVCICVSSEYVDEDEASEFIVKALNNQSELLEALEELIDADFDIDHTGTLTAQTERALQSASAAIAKAKGES